MLSSYLAHRIYGSKEDKEHISRPAIIVATLGTAVGLAVMIISVCVVLGFKHTIRDKIVGFGSHITVQNYSSARFGVNTPIAESDSLTNAIKKTPAIKNVQTYIMKQGILKSESEFLGVAFKGVGEEWDSTFIHQNLVSGSIPKFSSEASGNKIVISKIIADKLQLNSGDRIFAYFVDNSDVRMRRFTISGIYQTNFTKYDESICFTDIYTARKLNGWNDDHVSGYELTLSDFNRLDEAEQFMLRNINKHTDHYGETYATTSVIESNQQTFTWLRLLDLNIWIILALMVCVAAVTMTSGLLIIILERIQMIGTLKALGARNSLIRHTFLWFALFIIVRGVIIGDAIALGICLLQKYTGFVSLDPTTYYVSEAPVEINIPIIIIINILTIIVCTLVLIAPSLLISHIHPAKSIKFE